MYNISNKSNAIIQIQKFLSALFPNDPIPSSGRYDTLTREALVKFQTTRGLSPNGIVDYETWRILYADWLNANKNRRKPNIEFPLNVGDYGKDVGKIKTQAKEFGEYYNDYEWYDNGFLYSPSFGCEVERIRKILRLGEGSSYNLDLYLRIQEELDARRTIKNQN